jgi:hypothetical protein
VDNRSDLKNVEEEEYGDVSFVARDAGLGLHDDHFG